MDYKEPIENLLISLKKYDYDRRRIEQELGYGENYIDQAISRGGNRKLFHSLELLQKTILQKTSDKNIKFTAPIDKLIGEISEQLAANTAILNVLRPIVEELYASHRNEALLQIRIELNNLIRGEGEKILDLIQRKWDKK